MTSTEASPREEGARARCRRVARCRHQARLRARVGSRARRRRDRADRFRIASLSRRAETAVGLDQARGHGGLRRALTPSPRLRLPHDDGPDRQSQPLPALRGPPHHAALPGARAQPPERAEPRRLGAGSLRRRRLRLGAVVARALARSLCRLRSRPAPRRRLGAPRPRRDLRGDAAHGRLGHRRAQRVLHRLRDHRPLLAGPLPASRSAAARPDRDALHGRRRAVQLHHRHHGDLPLRLPPVRDAAARDGRRRDLHQPRLGDRRPPTGRPGQGRRHLLGDDGHAVRLLDLQRRDDGGR